MKRLHSIRLALFPSGSLREDLTELALDLLRDFFYAPYDSRLGRLLPTFLRVPLRRNYYARKQAALASEQADLQAILKEPAAVTVLFLPGLDWDSQLFQRPQQLATALAHLGTRVFYLLPQGKTSNPALRQIEPNLFLCAAPAATFRLLERPWVYTLTWNRIHLLALDAPRILYDFVDDLSVIHGDPARMQRYHAELLRRAEKVVTTSRRLQKAAQIARPDACYIPNGVVYEHFRPACSRNEPVPAEMAAFTGGPQTRPVIGYYGALARWFDYELYSKTALLRPQYEFVLIGPSVDASLEKSGLLQLPNVHWLGRKPYADLAAYLRWFDVATIPFKLENLTHAISPVKLFEYFAGGKLVVATPMDETCQYPDVLLAEGANDFASKLDEALKLKDDPTMLELIDRVARQNTWEVRARALLDQLD